MVGMLSGIPKTPLHARLKEEGRLDLDDERPFGTNVIPLCMTRDELRCVARFSSLISPFSRWLEDKLLLRFECVCDIRAQVISHAPSFPKQCAPRLLVRGWLV